MIEFHLQETVPLHANERCTRQPRNEAFDISSCTSVAEAEHACGYVQAETPD